MKVLWVLTLCALAASAVPIPEEERVSGENGWYIPQADGSLEWVSIEEGENMLSEMKQQEEKEGRLLSDSVTFYLYTNNNPTNPQTINESASSITNSEFNPDYPTRFVIHGWTQSFTSSLNKDICAAWLGRGKYNVVVVDWARARDLVYASSVAAVPQTGQQIASMINYLVANYGMSLDTTIVIAHSLGAHVGGYVGKNIKNGKLHTIYGLDPGQPLFSYNKPNERLNSTDAKYVESIQTNGGKLGFLEPIGEAAFYVNGGENQPGCLLDLLGYCSHERSCTYYAEAVALNNFPSELCSDYKEAVENKCNASYSGVKMGSDTNAYIATGQFYVPVHDSSPFGYGSY